MNWFFSQAWVDLCLRLNILDTKSCVALKETHIAKPCLKPVKKTAASNLSLSSLTSTSLMEDHGVALWIQYLRDSRAKDSLLQENKREQTIPETSGQPQQGSSKKYVQAELFSKTYQESESTSESWPETLPIWGMIANGELLPLEKPELDILENDGGAWPTPTVSDSGGGARPAQQGEKGWYNVNKDGTRWGAILRDAVPAHEKKWPTPTASDHKGGTDTPRKDTGVSRNDRLDHCLEPGQKGKLNPDWVEWLMGWPVGWTDLSQMDPNMMLWWEETISSNPAIYWEDDPADIPVGMKYHTPRLTTKKEHRSDRLKACGNGQVPQQVFLALKLLL